MPDPAIKYFSSPTELEVPEPPTASAPGELAPIVAHKLDWTALGYPEYEGKFAIVIDNAFTPADCAKLLAAAEATTSGNWFAAKVNNGLPEDQQYVDVRYRNSGRIMLDDFELSDWILDKVRPYLEDIQNAPAGKYCMFNRAAPRDSPTVELSRLNERLRFLKYGPGQYFNTHCDGTYFTPDRSEVSYYTLQLYINGDPESLKGGSTRFISRKKREGGRPYVDIMPRVGRVIVFQQAGLLHSGEAVISGEKFAMRTDVMYKRVPSAPRRKAAEEPEVSEDASESAP